MSSADTHPVTIPFHSPRRDDKVWILSDVNDWQPQEMSRSDESYNFTFQVPKARQTLLYKFRIGDWEWANNHEAPSESDGFGGINNRYEIPPPSVEEKTNESRDSEIVAPDADASPAVTQTDDLPEPAEKANDSYKSSMNHSVHESTALVPERAPKLNETVVEVLPRHLPADLEDEAYHSSDDTTPKASRQPSISEHVDDREDKALEQLAEDFEVTTTTPEKAHQTEIPASELNMESPSHESADSESDVTLIPEAIASAQPKTATIPMYLGIAAITVAIFAYFLRLIREVFPFANNPKIKGPVTKALKITAVTLVGIATVIEMIIEDVVQKQRERRNSERRSGRSAIKQKQKQKAS